MSTDLSIRILNILNGHIGLICLLSEKMAFEEINDLSSHLKCAYFGHIWPRISFLFVSISFCMIYWRSHIHWFIYSWHLSTRRRRSSLVLDYLRLYPNKKYSKRLRPEWIYNMSESLNDFRFSRTYTVCSCAGVRESKDSPQITK